MLSDQGSQLIAASKDLQDFIQGLDWKSIYTFGKTDGMVWQTTKSADSPWENGCSEALIKSVKRCLSSSIGSNVLTFSEMQTVLYDIADLLNDRPIGLKDNDPVQGTYLCPNEYLLGRTKFGYPGSEWMKTMVIWHSSEKLRIHFGKGG